MEMEINKVLVKENHIKHICKLFIIFVQLFLYAEIGWKREKNARQCLFVPYFNTSVHTYHWISLQKNLCWILIFFPLWTILFSNKMEGKDGKLDINIDTVWNFLTRLIRIFFFFGSILLIYTQSLICSSLFHFLSKSLLGHVSFNISLFVFL